jgi:hypothetical protein
MTFKQLPTQTAGQSGYLQQLLSLLGGQGQQGTSQALQYLMDMISGNPASYEKFEAPAMRQFNEQIIPGIAERFTGSGSQRSSGFQQALGSAGAGLEESLASQRGTMQQNSVQALLAALQGLSGQALGTQGFENVYQPKKQKSPGFFEQLLGGLSGGLGTGLGMATGAGGLGGLSGLLSMLGKSKSNQTQSPSNYYSLTHSPVIS